MENTELQRRRREKITGVLVFFFILLFTGIELYLLRLSSKLPFVNSIFFFGLMNLNVILIMLLLFLVFRNVVKLVLDERKGNVGSRLKTRLVYSFILFAIIPTILLFSISAIYIRNSFDKWFSVKIGSTLQKSIEVAQNFYENTERNANHFARKMAFDIQSKSAKDADIPKLLQHYRQEFGLDAVEFYPDPFGPRYLSAQASIEKNVPAASLETLKKFFSEDSTCRIQSVGGGELLRCGVSLGVGKGVVVADYFIPMSLSSRLTEITSAYEGYRSKNPLDYPIKSTYFAILSMMTLLILFAATWTGFYVARRLVTPLEELAKATEQIAKGNLDYQIDSHRSDELGKLVSLFNQMTFDLRENKRQIESTHHNLQQVNEELSHRKRYIEVLLESVQSGVLSLDSHGRVTTINHAAASLLSVEPDRLLGRSYSEILPREQRAEFQEMLRAVYDKARPIRREIRLQGKLKEPLVLLVTLSVLRDDSRRVIGVVAVFEDVTEIQRMQRMTAWREVAKRIAHEIKNPLTPIQLAVQRLQRRYMDKIADDGTFHQSTEIILKEVDSIKNLVSEFSAFARLPEIQQQPDDLNEIVVEAVSLFRAAHEQIRFELKLVEGLPDLNLDRAQLKRVLINLFDNAVAAMNGEGEIEVCTERASSEGVIRLTVGDLGCGIAQDLRAQLFEPYVSTKEGGTGLGLAIVQRIVNDHGGFVRILENQPRGARVVIEFTDSIVVASHRAQPGIERPVEGQA